MTRTIYALDKQAERNGLDLKISVSFFETEDGKHMELLSCTITDGIKSLDYALVMNETNLKDMIKDFIDA